MESVAGGEVKKNKKKKNKDVLVGEIFGFGFNSLCSRQECELFLSLI